MTTKTTIRLVSLTVILLLVVLAFSFKLCFLEDWVDGVLVWNAKDAYLFSSWSGQGYRSPALEMLVSLVPAFFGASRPPDDSAISTTVFHITPDRIERVTIANVAFRAYLPKGGNIYAWSGGPLWKWENNHFEPASAEEEKEVVTDPQLSILSASNSPTGSEGWSVRSAIAGWPPTSEIKVDGRPIQFLVSLADKNREIHVDARLANGRVDRLLDAKSQLRMVSASTYAERFPKNQNGPSHSLPSSK